MKDGIYRLTVSCKTGGHDFFRGAITQGGLVAWNADFNLSGSVNHLTSEIYIMKSTRGIFSDSIIDRHEHYNFTGITTLHESGFTINQMDDLQIVITGYLDSVYSHI